jgi:hypothetical protein
MLRITGIQLSTDMILTVYLLYRASKERDSVVFKCINISDVNIISHSEVDEWKKVPKLRNEPNH